MDELETIVIMSGSFNEDKERLQKAREYVAYLESQGKKVRILVSGMGPRLKKRLDQEGREGKDYLGPFEGTNDLDVHPELWSELVEETWEKYLSENEKISKEERERGEGGKFFVPFGIDTVSTTRIQSMVYTFPRGTLGSYTLISRKVNNQKAKVFEKFLREEGYLGKGLKINYVDTDHKYSIKERLHDQVSFWHAKMFGRKLARETVTEASQFKYKSG